jgi:trimethylamine--corrinoid protein Co-methyltransferase
MRPALKLLSPEEIHRLHRAALTILETTGVRFGGCAAERILLDSGLKIDTARGAVSLPADLVERCLSRLPASVLLAARDPRRDIVLGGGKVHLCLDGQGTFTLDGDSGERRRSTLADLVRATRLSDALESPDLYWCPVVAGDVGDAARPIAEAAAAYLHQTRHLMHECKRPQEAPLLLEMIDVLIGDRRRHRDRPILSLTVCPVSPLQHEAEMTDAALELARHFVPICFMSVPLAGATAPVSLASTIALTLAEFLSGVVLYQTAAPGCPMILGIGSTILDMRVGLYSAGAPELALLNLALTEIGHHLGVPVLAQGLVSDAKAPGPQAAWEKATNGLTALMAGSDVINGLGLLDAHQTLSLEQMVIDDEIFRSLRRIERGIDIDDKRLMLDLIHEAGPGGNFLGKRATLDYLRRGEHFLPRLGFRGPWESWRARRMDEVEEARRRARALLAEHRPQPLALEQGRALQEIVEGADRESAAQILRACFAA